MIVKVRREYLLEELEHRLRTLQKDLTDRLGIARLGDISETSCAFISCSDCAYFDRNHPCKTQEALNLDSLIVMLRDSKEEYFEIEVKGGELEF